MWAWLIGIHVAELIAVGIFLLIRRNNVLEKAVTQQQQYLDAISIIIQNFLGKKAHMSELFLKPMGNTFLITRKFNIFSHKNYRILTYRYYFP